METIEKVEGLYLLSYHVYRKKVDGLYLLSYQDNKTETPGSLLRLSRRMVPQNSHSSRRAAHGSEDPYSVQTGVQEQMKRHVGTVRTWKRPSLGNKNQKYT